MSDAILWSALWILFLIAGTPTLYALITLTGIGIAVAKDAPWVAFIAAILAWVAAAGWVVFAGIQAVVQILSGT